MGEGPREELGEDNRYDQKTLYAILKELIKVIVIKSKNKIIK